MFNYNMVLSKVKTENFDPKGARTGNSYPFEYVHSRSLAHLGVQSCLVGLTMTQVDSH